MIHDIVLWNLIYKCIFHKPLRGANREPFPDPVPMMNLYDPYEKNLPSKLEDLSKPINNVPFTSTAPTAKNVGYTLSPISTGGGGGAPGTDTLKRTECGNPRLFYSKNKLKPSFKRFSK